MNLAEETVKQFIHLHLHTTYSFLDGANEINDCIKRVKELGMTSVAITDHNHIGGWLDFRDACKKEGIKPIFGCEMYQTWDTNILSLTADERRELAINNYKAATGLEVPEKIGKKKITKKEIDAIIKDYVYDTKQYHIILLAMNQTGLNNLIKLQSEAADKCTYNGRFCCDFPMLEKYNEGLICLSACLGGMLPHVIRKDESKIDEIVTSYKNIFGDRFYLEMQPLQLEKQIIVNNKLIELSNKYDIELVATNDVHYTLEEDMDDHDTLLCVGIGKTKFDTERMRYEPDFWIKNYQEMYRGFYNQNLDCDIEVVRKALDNTNVIADRIEDNLKLGSDKPLFPDVYVPNGLTPEKYLILKSYKGLYKYKLEHPEIDLIKYEKRLYEELDIINSKGFAPYILKILENVEYCEENDIPLGPGRGSAAGALTLFVNGATKIIDPIKYNLLFFRFLTKDRVDPPDVDMDYSYYGRDNLIKHLEEVHGQEAVSHIGTYTVMGVKSGLKDFGRVLCIPFDVMNNISKLIDEITEKTPSIKFKDIDKYEQDAQDALDGGNEKLYNNLIARFNKFKNIENQYPELFRLARKFEGTPRNMGVHASGVLVMPCNVTDYFPTRTVDGIRVALFTGPQLEALGAIKLDILGLKTLDVMDKAIKSANPDARVNDLYKEIEKHLDDYDIFEMAQNKETEGLFQMESNLFKGLCSDIIPTDINDICAILAIG
jgi:DNA polymerase-3 subunit alpha